MDLVRAVEPMAPNITVENMSEENMSEVMRPGVKRKMGEHGELIYAMAITNAYGVLTCCFCRCP